MTAHERARRTLTGILVGLLFVTGVIGGALAATTAGNLRDKQRTAEELLLAQAEAVVGSAIESASASLLGARAVVAPDGTADRFTVFAEQVVRTSDLTAVGLVEWITHAQRASTERRLDRTLTELTADGLVEAGERDGYGVVMDLVAEDPASNAIVGFDVAAEPTRRAALMTAATAGDVGISGPIVSQPAGTTAVLIAAAARGPATAPRSPHGGGAETEPPPAQPLGDPLVDASPFIVSVVQVSQLVDAFVQLATSGARLELADGDDLLAATSVPPSPDSPSTTLDVGGRTWTIRVDDGAGVNYSVPLAIAFSTVVLVVALGVLVWRRIREQTRAIADADAALATSALVSRLATARSVDDVDAAIAALVPVATGAHRARLEHRATGDDGDPSDGPVAAAADGTRVVRLADGRRRQRTAAHVPVSAGHPPVTLVAEWDRPIEVGTALQARLATMAAITNQVLERVELAAAEHRVVDRLRDLTLETPQLDGLDVSIRYLASAEGLSLGGDWYDVVERGDGGFAFVIGDVAGHGIDSVAEMAEVRTVLRTLLVTGIEPAGALAHADSILAARPGLRMATAAVGLIDLDHDRLELVSAGHPPLILRGPDGSVEVLAGGRRSVLGFELHAPVEPLRRDFVPGSTLLAYTDGLIERRDEPIDSGIRRLAGVMASLPVDASAEDTCAAVIERLVPDAADDDVALAVVRRSA